MSELFKFETKFIIDRTLKPNKSSWNMELFEFDKGTGSI